MGGEGSAGHRMSKERRLQMIAAVSNPSDITRQKIGMAAKLHAEQVNLADRMRLAMKGNQYFLGHAHSSETKAHLSKVLTGRPFTDSHRKNLSIANKLRWQKTRVNHETKN